MSVPHSIPRRTSLGLRRLEDVMMVGAGISETTIQNEVSAIIHAHGPGHPDSHVLGLALENLLRTKFNAMENRIKALELESALHEAGKGIALARINKALAYADELWPESLEGAAPRNPVDANGRFLAEGIRRALKVES